MLLNFLEEIETVYIIYKLLESKNEVKGKQNKFFKR